MKTVLKVVSIVLVLALILLLFFKNRESFNSKSQFMIVEDAEYRGINLLGVNSLDTHLGTVNEVDCKNICEGYTECDGYSFYKPGNRCYLFSRGGFVYNRKGYSSGMKI